MAVTVPKSRYALCFEQRRTFGGTVPSNIHMYVSYVSLFNASTFDGGPRSFLPEVDQLAACTKDYHTINGKVGRDLRLLTGLYLIPRTSQTVWRPVHIIGECNVIVWLEWSQLDQLVHFYGPTWAKYSLRNGRRRCH
jgi:hypothetical protein